MSAATRVLRPRTAVAGWLLVGAAVLLVPVVVLVLGAAGADTAGARWTDLAIAAVLLLVVVVPPALLARSILRARVEVEADTVTRYRADRPVATMRVSDVEQVTVGWQAMPGVMRRRPTVTLLGPTGGSARGIAANGILLDDVAPLLEVVAAEVARRPDVLVSDRATYDEVMAGLRP